MSRGLGDVYKRQDLLCGQPVPVRFRAAVSYTHLTLPTTERV
ncbi:hypothetical protein JMUB7531_29200 [Staphylococcus aureus]